MNVSKTTDDTAKKDCKRVQHKAHLLGYMLRRALLPKHINIPNLFQCFVPSEATVNPKTYKDRGTSMHLCSWEEWLDEQLGQIPEGQRPGLKRRRKNSWPSDDAESFHGEQD